MTAQQIDIFEALDARDEGIERANQNADDTDREVVDAVLRHLMHTHGEFSANTARDLIPNIASRKLIGARFNSFRLRGLIRIIGEVVSTDVATHGKKINTYTAVRP